MNAFQFRLAAVVRIRETQLRTEESKLEQLFAQRARMESDMENLQRSLAESWTTSKNRPTLLRSDLIGMQSLEEHAKRERALFHSRLKAQDELMSKQQSVVVEVRRNLRLLEKLRLRRQHEWQLEADRELAALIDDATNARWSRRERQGDDSSSQPQNGIEMQTLPPEW